MDPNRRDRVAALCSHLGPENPLVPVVRELFAELDQEPAPPPVPPTVAEVQALRAALTQLQDQYEATIRDYENNGYGHTISRLTSQRDELTEKVSSLTSEVRQHRDALEPYRAAAINLDASLSQLRSEQDALRARQVDLAAQLHEATKDRVRVLPHLPTS